MRGAPGQAEEPPDLHVLLVGISEYDDANLRLYYAASDTQALREVIERRCRGLYRDIHLRTLIDDEATFYNILNELDATLRLESGQRDDCLVYFAGHGQNDEQDQLFLLPHDVEPVSLEQTALQDALLKERLAEIPARHLILLVDACHAGNETILNLIDDLTRELLRPDYGVMVLAAALAVEAARGGQRARRHSFFTSALIDGLNGAAETFEDGLVMNHEVDDFVKLRVPESTRGQQRPTGNVTAGSDPFPLSKLDGTARP